ncbi:DASS family sodium-coupled anion symporter [Flavobacteriaceae bacterium Ap0902]|nr:DASS family sodium-coupled anion symporter [Flavobacteriaceae bacterium Ap0902]
MADSRRAAERLVNRMQRIVDAQQRIIYFLLSIIGAFMVTFYITTLEDEFSLIQQYVFFILIFAVALWVTEAIPPFAVGILIVGLLIFLIGQVETNVPGDVGYIDVTKFVGTWSNSVIWLMLGGFFLALALRKTGLDKDLFHLTMSKVGNKPTHILMGMMGATAMASMVMSNTATTAMMIASIVPFINKLGKDHGLSKSLLVGIPSAAAIGGMGTIIGSPPNAIAVEAINSISKSQNLGISIGFLEWMILGVPVAVILVFFFWWILNNKFKLNTMDIQEVEKPKVEISTLEEKFQKRMVLSILVITVLLWLTGRWHGIPSAAVSGIPIIIFPMIGIISGENVREIPWDTLMLVAGGLSLGLAIQESGLAEFFVAKLSNFTFNEYIFMVLFSLATVLFSNIMSNTATATILIPVASILPGVNPAYMAMIIGLSASCALFLPVSTPPNAIAFSTGLLKQSDFRLGGITVGLLGPILAILWVVLLYLIGYF